MYSFFPRFFQGMSLGLREVLYVELRSDHISYYGKKNNCSSNRAHDIFYS